MTKTSPHDNPARRRPTSYDVASLAGVSQSAVSRCFRPGNSISDEKRKAILKAAAKLGYEPNAFASSLITKRSNLVAVLISNLTNLYYPQVLAELTQRLDAQGIRVLLFALQNESDVGKVLPQIWRYRVDGTIAAAHLSPEHLAQFARHRVPVVLYNRSAENDAVPSVFCDSVGGERLLVDRLVEAGHRRFVILSGPEDSYVSNQRVEGAQMRLAHHELSATVFPGRFDHESGAAGLRRALSMKKRPDVLICANDLMAIGALDAARDEFGLAVPGDLSVVGFDGVGPAAWPSYRLTTIRQPVRRMTEAAVTMLLERIVNPELPPETRSFSGALIEGRSARLNAER
jgi:DNA-binding LacI/PurR family transcriptional regulator